MSEVSGAPHAEDVARLDVAPLQGFRSDIQALRGLAVLVVVLFHAEVLLPGGFVGVDVFFVISGFVIGRLLVAQLESTGRVGFRAFYVRRARRILPALGLMLAVVVLLAPLLAPVGATAVTRKTGVAAALFGANAYLYRVTAGGYFAAAADWNPLLHTWSLSVEEQFYFVIPALLFLSWKLGRGRWRSLSTLRVFVVGLLAASLVASLVFSHAGGDVGPLNGLRFAFYSPFTRAWEFAAGLVLVVLPVPWFAAKVRSIAVVSGLALIGVSTLRYSDATVFPGLAALLPVVGAALVIYGGTTTDGNGLSTRSRTALRPMIWLGNISYSWYLWHWPVIVFAGALWPTSGSLPLVVAGLISLLPAWLSYRFLEQRLRATPTTRARSTLVLAACCVAAPLVAAALTQPLTALVERRSGTSLAEATDLHVSARRGCNSATPLGDTATAGCAWGDTAAKTSVVLIGDSNAGQFSEALIEAAENNNARLRIAAAGGCPFSDVGIEREEQEGINSGTACRRFVLGSIEDLERHPPDVVVIANATDGYVTRDGEALIDPTTDKRVSGMARRAVFKAGLERLVALLRAAGSRVVIINVVPKPLEFGDPRACSNLAALVDVRQCTPPPFALRKRADLRAANALEDSAARRAGADVWSFNTKICPAGLCKGERDGALVWRDAGHVSVTTTERLAPIASRCLKSLVEGRDRVPSVCP